MKISLKELRKVVREEIEHMYLNLGSDDKDLRPGAEVGVATPTGPVKGRVVSRYSGEGEDSLWSIKTDQGTVMKKAEDLKAKDDTDEASTMSGRSTMLHGSEDDESEKGKHGLESDDDLLIDITEVDEKHEQKEFTRRHYEFMAKQIVFNWRDKTPEVSWKAVADNFARGLRASTGKILDVDKLYDAIQTCLSEDDAYEAQWSHRKEMIGI